MPYSFIALLGKTVRSIARLRGGGSALPGLFVERIDPNFVAKTLQQLPLGVVVVSGTNGKTTTTKMVVELLEGQGLTVFTNRTGSNFSRGVAAALLADIDIRGRLTADIAVLELDEAHGAKFVKTIAPRYSLILNVMRDQLDRFGEIDHTAQLLATIATATSDTVVLNRNDARVAAIAQQLKTTVRFFGLHPTLVDSFPSDDDLHTGRSTSRPPKTTVDVELAAFSDGSAEFVIDNTHHTTTLKLNGIYNIYNAAAALALVRAIMGTKVDQTQLLGTLSTITPAFGRGESFTIGGQPLELVLVKNPSGFRLGLESFTPKGYATMIAINDNYADGRDLSWLWDVDFASLKKAGVAMVSGIRAYDMALRLQYDEVPVTQTEPQLATALRTLLQTHTQTPKRIYCTYTAMLALRKELSTITNVEVIA